MKKLAIGDRTAEEIKIQMGSAWPMEEELTADIRGRDLISGLPRTIQLTTEHVREALAEPIAAIVDAVKTTLDKTPPELAADIMEDGITVTGGGALLGGLDERLAQPGGRPFLEDADIDLVPDHRKMCVQAGAYVDIGGQDFHRTRARAKRGGNSTCLLRAFRR